MRELEIQVKDVVHVLEMEFVIILQVDVIVKMDG